MVPLIIFSFHYFLASLSLSVNGPLFIDRRLHRSTPLLNVLNVGFCSYNVNELLPVSVLILESVSVTVNDGFNKILWG